MRILSVSYTQREQRNKGRNWCETKTKMKCKRVYFEWNFISSVDSHCAKNVLLLRRTRTSERSTARERERERESEKKRRVI